MKRMRIAGVAAVTATMLAACGNEPRTSGLNLPEYQGSSAAKDDGRSAAQVLSDARTALAAADSVTVKGWTAGTDGSLVADLAFSGPDGSGSYSFGAGMLQVLIVDGQAWWKGDEQIYSAFGVNTTSVTRKIDDRWIVAGSSHPKLATIQTPTDRAELLDDFIDPEPEESTIRRTVVDGAEAMVLTNPTGTLFVAADTSLPVRLVLPGDDGDGIAFSYDGVTRPTPPPDDRILDLSDLR
jgi:hypothetical protein